VGGDPRLRSDGPQRAAKGRGLTASRDSRRLASDTPTPLVPVVSRSGPYEEKMARESIQFAVDNTIAQSDFEIEHLRVGGTIYVGRFSDGFMFSNTPKQNWIPYKIARISLKQPEGYRYVTLLREPIIQPSLAQRIVAAAHLQLSVEEVNQRLRKAAAADVPFDKLQTDGLSGGPRIRCWKAVVDRLDLVGVLNQQDVGHALWLHHRSLVAYLLLTCFDLLGQDPDWMKFDSWLKSNSTKQKNERQQAIQSIPDGAGPVETTEALLARYNEIYSMGSGFKNLLRDKLPDQARRNLFDTIAIKKCVAPPLAGETELPIVLDEEKKIDWLFQLRNGYTHRAEYVPGSHPDALPEDYRGDDRWWRMDDRSQSKSIVEYSVSGGWLAALEQAVRATLATVILELG
jgi:hypothetical protein